MRMAMAMCDAYIGRNRSAAPARRDKERTRFKMAKIVGGVATSHTSTTTFAKDAKKFDEPVWKPILEGYEPVQKWYREKKPDVLIYIYNDHMTSFFDHYSHFALGVGEEFKA